MAGANTTTQVGGLNSGGGGSGDLLAANNLSDLLSASTARTNLGFDTLTNYVTLAGTQTLTNKTLTTPTIADIRGTNAKSVFRLNDGSSNVNYWDVFASNTGAGLTIRAGGTDTNIAASFYGKGTGAVTIGVSTSTNTELYGTQIGAYTASGTMLLTAAGISALTTTTSNTATVTNVEQRILSTSGTAATGLGLSKQTYIEIAAGSSSLAATEAVYLTDGTSGAANVLWTLDAGSSSINAFEILGASGIKLGGSTSGYVTIKPSATAGDWTFTLPANDGNSGDVLQTDGAGVGSWVAPSGGGSGGVGSSIAIYKQSDETVTSSTTVQDDNEFSFAIGANEVWEGVWFPTVISAGTDGLKVCATIPSGATGRKRITWGTTGIADSDITTESGSTFQWLIQTYGRITFRVVNSSTAGTVQFRWAQNVSGAAGTTMRAGSYLTATRMS